MRVTTHIQKKDIKPIGFVLENTRAQLQMLVQKNNKRFEIVDRVANLNNINKLHLMFAEKNLTHADKPAQKSITVSVDINQLRSLVEECKTDELHGLEKIVFVEFLTKLLKNV